MDATLYRWMNRLADHTGWAHGAFRFYANYGVVLFAVLLLAAFVDGRAHDQPGQIATSIWAGGAALVAVGLVQVIGGAVDRLRPYDTIANARVLVDRTTDFSFPSDHATMAGAVAVGLWLANRRWGIVAAAAALLMAFTRVYVGAHYPGDVLAGLALGGLVAAAGWFVIVPLLTRLVKSVGNTRLRPLVAVAGH